MLEKRLKKESEMVKDDSISILKEFEDIEYGTETIWNLDCWFEHSNCNWSRKEPATINCQTNLLNKLPHPSAIVCPITTNVEKETEILRAHLKKETANLQKDCDIVIDQIRAIDNKRLINKIGDLPKTLIDRVKNNIKIMMDTD